MKNHTHKEFTRKNKALVSAVLGLALLLGRVGDVFGQQTVLYFNCDVFLSISSNGTETDLTGQVSSVRYGNINGSRCIVVDFNDGSPYEYYGFQSTAQGENGYTIITRLLYMRGDVNTVCTGTLKLDGNTNTGYFTLRAYP